MGPETGGVQAVTKSLPDIIRAAASSELGLVALAIIIVAIVALVFFYRASTKVRALVFASLFLGAALFVAAILVQRDSISTATDPAPPIADNGARSAPNAPTASAGQGVEPTPLPEPAATGLIERQFKIDETNTDYKSIGTHTVPYTRVFQADAGHVISSYKWHETSATRVSDFVINLVDGGRGIEVRFKLKCGPKTDRYRGWLRGSLVTQQVPIGARQGG
jgi:type II secretory pathway pseudopilin PulG